MHGEIIPQGAKNEALQVLSAVLLTDEPVTISNLPDIRDTQRYKDILSLMGVKITKLSKDTFTFQADDVNLDVLTTAEFAKLSTSIRASIMVLVINIPSPTPVLSRPLLLSLLKNLSNT